MKFIHKLLNKEKTPWVKIVWEAYYSSTHPGDRSIRSYWWKDILKLLHKFKQIYNYKVGKGDTILF